MKVVVYTAIFGGYERPRPPSVINRNVKYMLFTDRPGSVDPWEPVVVAPQWSMPKTARHYKAVPHLYMDADVSIWHGGWLQLTKDPLEFLGYLKDNDIAMEPHKERNCAYQEAAAVVKLKKANKATVNAQMARYRNMGLPERYGLTSAFLIVRRHTDRIAELNEMWWSEIEQFSVRDQLSLMPCMWRLGLDYDRIPVGPHGFYRTHKHGG